MFEGMSNIAEGLTRDAFVDMLSTDDDFSAEVSNNHCVLTVKIFEATITITYYKGTDSFGANLAIETSTLHDWRCDVMETIERLVDDIKAAAREKNGGNAFYLVINETTTFVTTSIDELKAFAYDNNDKYMDSFHTVYAKTTTDAIDKCVDNMKTEGTYKPYAG